MAKLGPARLAMAINTLGTGGVPEAVLGLTRHLPRDRFDPRLYVMRPPLDPAAAEAMAARFEQAGIPVVIAPPGDGKLGSVAQMADWLAEARIDILHSHSFRPNLYARLAGVLGRQGGLRMIAQYHNQYDDKWTEGSYALGLERHLAQTTDAMIAVSGAVRDHVAARLLIDPGRVDVVLNGIDPDKVRDCDRDAARQALGLRADDLAIGCVGRVCRQKGQDLFVQAALALLHRMPRAQFLIIGSPEDAAMTDALIRRIADAGAADRIRFLGHRPDIAPIYRALDVLAAPSRWEGFGLMLAEAMAAGCAVVASAVGAIPEVTAGAAVLVPPDDPDALAKALAGLGGPQRKAMQAKGMIRARAFGWEQAAAEVAAIYDRVLA